jgi:hypothetical protein
MHDRDLVAQWQEACSCAEAGTSTRGPAAVCAAGFAWCDAARWRGYRQAERDLELRGSRWPRWRQAGSAGACWGRRSRRRACASERRVRACAVGGEPVAGRGGGLLRGAEEVCWEA